MKATSDMSLLPSPQPEEMLPTPDDKPFRHYSLRHRMVAYVSSHVFDHLVYTVRHGLIRGMRRKGGLGWAPQWIAARGITPEQEFYQNRDFTGKIVYDIGAFHGFMTLFFSKTARQVVSYEPTNVNSQRLRENLRLNGIANVTVRQVALGETAGAGEIVYMPLMSGGASLDSNITRTVTKVKDARTESISITTLDRDIQEAHLPLPDFMKIDVEGFELAVLKGARSTLQTAAPELFIEMHGETMNEKRRNVADVVSFLKTAGYRNILHIESGAAISMANTDIAAQGHLYCTA